MRYPLAFLCCFVLSCQSTTAPVVTQPIAPPQTTSSVMLPREPVTASWLDAAPTTAAPSASEAVLAKGRDLFLKNCANCHGTDGGGDGPDSRKTPILARDFTQAIFKFRSTPTGSLPTDADLFRTLTRGIPGSGMEGYASWSEDERWAVVRYVQELTAADETDEKRTAVVIPEPSNQGEKEAVQRGRGYYLVMNCWSCHGTALDAKGTRSNELIDDWGYAVQVPDLNKPWPYKGGATPKDLYKTLVTGLDGSPMPSYPADSKWLRAQDSFPSNWKERFARDLPPEALADLETMIALLPKTLPKDEASQQKLATQAVYDLVAYLRTLPRAVKE